MYGDQDLGHGSREKKAQAVNWLLIGTHSFLAVE